MWLWCGGGGYCVIWLCLLGNVGVLVVLNWDFNVYGGFVGGVWFRYIFEFGFNGYRLELGFWYVLDLWRLVFGVYFIVGFVVFCCI